MEITSPSHKNSPKIVMDLLSTNDSKEESKLCSSFISLFKGDLSQTKLLSRKLGIETQKAIPVIAASLGNMKILSEFYSNI